MNTKFSDVPKFDFSDFIVTKFHHYAAHVGDVIAEYNTIHYEKPRGDKFLKEMYDHYILVANAYLVEHTGHKYSTFDHENKTVIEITSIINHTKLYIGRKDDIYTLGTSVYTEDSYGCEEFKLNRK